jgi:hypothetical protein
MQKKKKKKKIYDRWRLRHEGTVRSAKTGQSNRSRSRSDRQGNERNTNEDFEESNRGCRVKPSRKEIEMETKTADWTRNNYTRQEGRRERHAQVRPNPNTDTGGQRLWIAAREEKSTLMQCKQYIVWLGHGNINFWWESRCKKLLKSANDRLIQKQSDCLLRSFTDWQRKYTLGGSD